LRKVTGLGDVLRGNPDVVTHHRSGAVVAPTWPRRIGEVERDGVREAVIGSQSGRGNVDGADTDLVVYRSIAGTRIEARADPGERHDAAAGSRHADRWIGQVIVGNPHSVL